MTDPDRLDDIMSARRMSRAFITGVMSADLENETVERLGDELAVEHQFQGVMHLAATSLSLLRMASTNPLDLAATFDRRHFDARARLHSDLLLPALQADPSARSEEVREAAFAAGQYSGRDVIRDLGLIGAAAAQAVALNLGVDQFAVMEVLAKGDEQHGPGWRPNLEA